MPMHAEWFVTCPVPFCDIWNLAQGTTVPHKSCNRRAMNLITTHLATQCNPICSC